MKMNFSLCSGQAYDINSNSFYKFSLFHHNVYVITILASLLLTDKIKLVHNNVLHQQRNLITINNKTDFTFLVIMPLRVINNP